FLERIAPGQRDESGQEKAALPHRFERPAVYEGRSCPDEHGAQGRDEESGPQDELAAQAEASPILIDHDDASVPASGHATAPSLTRPPGAGGRTHFRQGTTGAQYRVRHPGGATRAGGSREEGGPRATGPSRASRAPVPGPA